MKDQVKPAAKRRRLKILDDLARKQSLKRHQKLVGKTVSVLVEGPSPESDLLIQGRTAGQAQEIDGHVLINDLGTRNVSDIHPGDVLQVEITEALPYDWIGRVV